MPEIWQFGPFMIRFDWLLLAIAGLTGYAVMKYKLKKTAHDDKPVLDILTGGLLIAALVWKFSPVLFSPTILLKNPFRALLMSGSSEGAWFGSLAGAVYIGFKSWRMYGFRWLLPDLLPYGIATMVTVYSLLSWQYGVPTNLPWGISIENPAFKYHPVNVYRIVVTVPLLIWLWKRKKEDLGSGQPFADFMSFYGIGLLLVSFFETKTEWIFGMSAEQLLYFVMVILGSILSMFLKKKKQNPVDQGVDAA